MKRKIRPSVPRQLEMALDAPVLGSLTGRERAQTVSLLAQLLLEASSWDHEEGGDEDV